MIASPNSRAIHRTSATLDLVATGAIVITCIVLIAANWSRLIPPIHTTPIPKAPVSIEGAALRGDPRAPVVLIEWSDYECPYCGTAERQLIPAIDDRFIKTNQVQLAVFHYPLVQMHPHAERAAEAAVCAGLQGKFWAMHSALFADQKRLDESSLSERVSRLSLDPAVFAFCMANRAQDLVRSDVKRAEALSLGGTPTFLIGRRQPDGRVRATAVLTGVAGISEFQHAIEDSGKS